MNVDPDDDLDLFNGSPSPSTQPSSPSPGSQALQSYLTSHGSPSSAIPLLTLYTTARETAALPINSMNLFRTAITQKLQYEESIDVWANVLSFYCRDANHYTRADGDLRRCLADAFYGKDFYVQLDRNGKFAMLKRKEGVGWHLGSFFLEALAAARRADDSGFLEDMHLGGD